MQIPEFSFSGFTISNDICCLNVYSFGTGFLCTDKIYFSGL